MSNSDVLFGVAIGIGVGYLNATALSVPGWLNILMMGLVAVGAELERGGN